MEGGEFHTLPVTSEQRDIDDETFAIRVDCKMGIAHLGGHSAHHTRQERFPNQDHHHRLDSDG